MPVSGSQLRRPHCSRRSISSNGTTRLIVTREDCVGRKAPCENTLLVRTNAHVLYALPSCNQWALLALRWARDRTLSRWRMAPAAALAVAIVLLLCSHAGALPRFRWPLAPSLQSIGAVALLLGCVGGRALLWNATNSPARGRNTMALFHTEVINPSDSIMGKCSLGDTVLFSLS